jgi:hypothetical protein
MRSRLREHAARHHARAPRLVLSLVVTAALVAAMVGGFIATRGSGTRSIPNGTPRNVQVLQALTSGAAAAPIPDASSSYVWLTGTLVTPSNAPCVIAPGETSTPGPSGSVCTDQITTEVDVLDWTGALRYHFQLSPAVAELPDGIAAISPDGTRALLSDGTVIDQTGAAVGDLATVGSLFSARNLMPGGPIGVRWLSDDSGVCLAGPSAVMADDGSASGQTTTTGTTLEAVPIDGQPRTIATLATGQTSSDPISVDACNLTTDTATLAVFTATSASNLNAFSERVWSVRLSTGVVTYEQTPPVRTDEGGPWSVGSADGNLAVEGTWNSQVDGCGADEVVNLPLGELVPMANPRGCPEVLALSADGSRFVVSDFDPSTDTAGTLRILDASDGAVVRSIQLPADVGVAAVAAPSGADFMFLVNGYLVLVDGRGGATQLHPVGVNFAGSSAGTFFFPLTYTIG